MEGVGSDGRGGDLTGEDDEGDTIAKSVLHGGNDVCSSGTGGDENDAGFPGNAGITLGHVTRTLFVSGKDEMEVGRVVDGIEDGQDGPAGIAEDVLDTMPEHHLVEDLSAGLPNEGMIEVLFLHQGRGLVRDVAAGGEDRCGCRSPKGS